MAEIIIKNADIIDGTGSKRYKATIGCTGGKIFFPSEGEEIRADLEIDGSGMIVCPGFIDAHSHGDIPLGKDFSSISKINQGITTEMAGQCGFSMFPVRKERLGLLQDSLKIFSSEFPDEMEGFSDLNKFFAYAEKQKLKTNMKFLVGHVNLRIAVMGCADRKPNKNEMEMMKKLLRQSMEQGAQGMSSGLIYIPSAFADLDELISLCEVVREYDGIYTTHMRNESYDILGSIKETIEVARITGVRVQISHLKICGKSNWKLTDQALSLIEEARKEGLRITCDQYPYTASMTHLNVCIPPKYLEGGVTKMTNLLLHKEMRDQIRKEIEQETEKFDNMIMNCGGFEGIFLSAAKETPEAEGKTIAQYAEEQGIDPYDALFNILIKNKGVATAMYFCMDEKSVADIMKKDYVAIGTDGIVWAIDNVTHPRAYGTFAYAIHHYVNELHCLSMEKMIYKMTGLPAEIYRIKNKGTLKQGADFDVVVFSEKEICSGADYKNPTKVCKGIIYVINGGKIVWENGRMTDYFPGQLIREGRS